MPDHEITLGEVGRRLGEVLVELRDMRNALIGRAEYESDQEHINSRFEESAKVHTQLESKVVAEGAAREVAITKEATAREKDIAELRASNDRTAGWVKWTAGAAISVAGLILTVLGWLVVNGGGS